MKKSRISSFLKSLLRDRRGEDYTEKSSQLTTTAKVVLFACAATAAGSGVAVAANNANKTTDNTQQRVMSVTGAQSEGATEKVDNPFKK